MSYCRWSSMDWQCDLYCYEAEEGYVTVVAMSRFLGDIPKAGHLNIATQEWFDAHAAQMEFLKTAERESIQLPHAGEQFCDDSLTQFRNRLIYLRELGYRFPDSVLDAIDEEMAEKVA